MHFLAVHLLLASCAAKLTWAAESTGAQPTGTGTAVVVPVHIGTSVVGTGGTMTRSSSATGQMVSIGGPSASSITMTSSRVINGIPSGGSTVGGVQFVPSVVTVDGTNCQPVEAQLVSSSMGMSAPSRTQADGSKTRDCYDFTAGFRAHGEEFNRGNSFRYKCNNGQLEIIACIGSQRTNFAIIPLSETLDVNGFWHKCEYFEKNQTVRYSQEPSCFADGKELKVGDTFRSGSFFMKCERTGYTIASCVYYDADGKVQSLELGKTADVDNMRYHCEEDTEVKGRVKFYVNRINCVKDGTTYKPGEEWQGKHLRYKCGENGAYDIIGCITEEGGKSLNVGEDYVFNNTVYRCYKQGFTVYYHEYACGFPGTPSCTPEPIVEDKTSVPTGVQMINLLPGWQIVDASGNPVIGLQPVGGTAANVQPANGEKKEAN